MSYIYDFAIYMRFCRGLCMYKPGVPVYGSRQEGQKNG